MDNAIGALRQRVRDAVAAASPALAHLATLDVVMEDVVGGRERALLAQVPGLLAQRYERLQAEGAEDLTRASSASCNNCWKPSWTSACTPWRACWTPCARPPRTDLIDKEPMNRTLQLLVFLAGLAGIAWVGAGYVGTMSWPWRSRR
jgi:hypothetical protein